MSYGTKDPEQGKINHELTMYNVQCTMYNCRKLHRGHDSWPKESANVSCVGCLLSTHVWQKEICHDVVEVGGVS